MPVAIICAECGKEFHNYPSNERKYCSKKCAGVGRRKSLHVSEEWTRLRQAWRGMKARCYVKHAVGYMYYGGRGIAVCREWLESFVAFYDWAMSSGFTIGLELDRRDNHDDYCPENCRWATRAQQMQNIRKRANARTSRFKGVSWCANANKWRAQIRPRLSKSSHIGLFATEREAAIAYDAAATKEFGEFAVLNFPKEGECLTLVLSRKKNECIDIEGGAAHGGVTITIVEIRGDKCRLGIDAPKELSVHRREVEIAISREIARQRPSSDGPSTGIQEPGIHE